MAGLSSYYETLGETWEFEESRSGDSENSSEGRLRNRWSRPGSAATGGISSDSVFEEKAATGDERGWSSPWDGWAEDGSWQGTPARLSAWREEENWSYAVQRRDRPRDRRWDNENWSFTGSGGGLRQRSGHGDYENWSWKDGCDADSSVATPSWGNWEVDYVDKKKEAGSEASSMAAIEEESDKASSAKLVGETTEKKPPGKISSSYPPIFKAKPGESFVEWKRSVEFWIGGEGSQLPSELVGPRMMVQLKERAAQLVKHLSNEDVNKPDGKKVILAALERSPLIRQLDKHRVDEHRRRMMTLNRAPGESMESYVTRASIYRTHLLAMDESMAMGEAFFVGHLVDHAHLTRRDRAMVKTKAGSETDELLVTNALIELACELEGESGYPIGASEPNAARNGEEWLLQRGEGRGGRLTPNKPPRGVFAADVAGPDLEESEGKTEDPGEDSLDEGDFPPELASVVNEAFGIQHRAKQKIAEVKKLRQYYRRPDPEERKKALAEQMRKHPCHACGQYGHWSRECPTGSRAQPALQSHHGPTQAVLAATSRKVPSTSLPTVGEEDEWELLASMCRSGLNPAIAAETGMQRASSSWQYKGEGRDQGHHVFAAISHPINEIMWSVKDLSALNDILWSMKDLAYKVILDLGCMRSVAGLEWINMLVKRWKGEGRWCQVMEEREAFKFGDGEILHSRFRVNFVGSFAGKPVVYGFSVVPGSCPPLFSRSGCTQIGAIIDCEHHRVSVRKLGVSAYGVGQETGHYTMPVDECDSGSVQLPEDYRLPLHQDIAAVNAEILGAQAVDSDDDSFQMTYSMDLDAGEDRDRPRKATTVRGARPKAVATPSTKSKETTPEEPEVKQLTPEEAEFIRKRREKQRPQGFDGGVGGIPVSEPLLERGAGAEHRRGNSEPYENMVLEEDGVDGEDPGRRRAGRRQEVETQQEMASGTHREGDRRAIRPFRVDEAEDARPNHGPADVTGGAKRPNRGVTQKLKKGVAAGLDGIHLLQKAVQDDGKWVLLEVFAGTGQLTRRAKDRPGWRVLEPIDLNTGWDLSVPTCRASLLKLIEDQQPDLVTMAPSSGPWSTWEALCEDADGLYERRRQQLPLWKMLGDIWALQVRGRRLALVEQPAQSRAFELEWMREREDVTRAVVHLCRFGLRDPENHKPFKKTTILEVNNPIMAKDLVKGAYCQHRLQEHQSIKGECKMGEITRKRSAVAAEWTPAFCDHILDAAETALGAPIAPGISWSLAAETVGPNWEAAPVTSGSTAEENVREQLAKHGMTGSRYDYITFDGEEAQQPRRLRAMVAHVHVTLGHLSNDRLARMFILSGAQKGVIALAKSLRCQICAMVRPPGQVPKVSYRKPKQFNERVSGDTFFVWDADNNKFAVVHFLDALTDYHIGDLTESLTSNFAREVLTDLWYGVFGPPDHLITDGGMEFRGSVEALNSLFGVIHEVVPEGAKWRMGQAERHGAVAKLMIMRMVRELQLRGAGEMRRAAIAAFAAKNRTCNDGGVSPMQAVTGRNVMLPGSLMDQITSGRVRFRFNEAATKSEAVARAERIRAGAVESFHWLDAHQALRKALSAKSRPPDLEGIKEGTVVYVYEPPPSRRGLARRLQDNLSWSGPGVVVCVEKDGEIPRRLWVRLRGKVKAYPLEKVRLATADEATSAQFITEALQEVEAELRGGNLLVDNPEEPAPAKPVAAEAGSSSSSSSSSSDEADGADQAEPADDEEAERTERRAKLLEDVPWSVKRTLADRRQQQGDEACDPHELDFQKKQRLFEKLSKQFGAPSKLQEGDLRHRMENAYAKVRAVRKVIRRPKKDQAASSRQAKGERAPGRQATAEVEVLAAEGEVPMPEMTPGELEAMIHDTMGQWTLWTGNSAWNGVQEILEVSAEIRRQEVEGVTEVITGRARSEYKWGELDSTWKDAYVAPLKKAIQVYVDHGGIKGVPQGQMVDPARILGSRFVLTNKGGEDLAAAELRARWIFGGHRDPDAGLYATSSPTASLLGHNLINFVAVQKRWVVHYEDVSSAFLQGKELPRREKIYVRVPRGYPDEVVKYLVEQLGADCRADLVELTKAGFGLPESPRLWYLEYKDCIQELGLEEMKLIPGVFRAFHKPPRRGLRAMASIHVDDTRFAGDETAQEIWDRLRARLKFGKHRQATDGWVKFCGRWERQDPDTYEMEYSMDEYVKNIPLARIRNDYGEPKTEPTSATTISTSRTSPVIPGTQTSTPTSSSTSSPIPGTQTSTSASSSTSPIPGTQTSTSASSSTNTTSPVEGSESDIWEILQRRVVHDDGDEQLTDGEKKLISSLVGQLNWAARQGRYDLSYVASLVQQLAGHGRKDALRWLNLGIKRAQESLNFKVRNFGCELEEMLIVSVSDAAYGAMPGGHSQGGNLVLLAHPSVLRGLGPVCILEGNSTKIHRVVRCSMSAEISSLTTSYEHGDFVRASLAELINPDFELTSWKKHVAQWPHILTTDAKTGYDAISSEAMPADRKIAIDVAVLRQAVLEEGIGAFVRWVPGSEMAADGLTKWGHNKVLCRVIGEGEWALADNEAAQALRRAAALKKANCRKGLKDQ
ncbi:RE2 [Symbiodinium sp. CCMP2592]|nr:RE2 [Symbiodinium sp. CCMP2592]